MLVATWNLNNRVGRISFRPDAANAAIALGSDVIVFTEYYPREHHEQFCHVLAQSGLSYQLLSIETGEVANRILIVARLPLERDNILLPDFDSQFLSSVDP
jgi:hypothetical protein